MRPKRRHVLPGLALAAALAGASARNGRRAGARVWMTTGDKQNLLTRAVRRGASARPPTASRRSPSTRAGAYQRMDGFGASITDSSAHRALPARPRPRRDHARPVRPEHGHRPQLPAPADGRVATSSTARTTPTTTCRPGRPTTACAHFSIAHDREADPAAAAPGAGAQPAAEGHRHAVEPAGVDEDQRLARSAAGSSTTRASTTPTRSYFVKFVQAYRARRRAGRRASRCRTSRRTATRAAIPGMDLPRRRRRRSSIEALGPALRSGRACDTKILGYDHNWSVHPNDVAARRRARPRPEYPTSTCSTSPARSAGSPAPRSTATPATRARRPTLHDAHPGQGHLVHRVLGLARPDDPPTHVPRTR